MTEEKIALEQSCVTMSEINDDDLPYYKHVIAMFSEKMDDHPSFVKHHQDIIERAAKCNQAWHTLRRYPIEGIELKKEDKEQYVLITRDTRDPSMYRVTYFDANGLSGHATYETALKCLQEAIQEDYLIHSPGSLERLSETKDFKAGLNWAGLIAQHNRGELPYQEVVRLQIAFRRELGLIT